MKATRKPPGTAEGQGRGEVAVASPAAADPLFSVAAWREAQRVGTEAAGVWRLPFRRQSWAGSSGRWSGHHLGTSADFHDHRAYLPGDDPRQINWQAFARTGHYSMKQFREETSPGVDLVLDASPSMFLEPEKAQRSAELVAWVWNSAQAAGASLRAYSIRGGAWDAIDPEQWAAGQVATPGSWSAEAAVPDLAEIPWRASSLRVVVSDVLFPVDFGPWMGRLTARQGCGVLLTPWTMAERHPNWRGTLELADCESPRRAVVTVSPRLLEDYRLAYQRHWAAMQEAAVRHRVAVAEVPSHGSLLEALWQAAEATPTAVEPVS